MSSLQPFSVTIKRTRITTMEALVWAEDRSSAIDAAMAEEDLSSDAWDEKEEAVAQPVEAQLLEQLPPNPFRVLLVPEPRRPGRFTPTWREVETAAEFAAFAGTELGERLRLSAIENGNGQLSPLETGGAA